MSTVRLSWAGGVSVTRGREIDCVASVDMGGRSRKNRVVMDRLAASILVAWAFTVGPALCAGGWIVHACAETHCGQDVEDDGCENHGCDDDPCRTALAPVLPEGRVQDDHLPAPERTESFSIAGDLASPEPIHPSPRHGLVLRSGGPPTLTARTLPLLI